MKPIQRLMSFYKLKGKRRKIWTRNSPYDAKKALARMDADWQVVLIARWGKTYHRQYWGELYPPNQRTDKMGFWYGGAWCCPVDTIGEAMDLLVREARDASKEAM